MSSPTSGVKVYGELPTGAGGAVGVTTATQATGTLTFSGNAVAGEAVRVGSQVYTWAASANSQTPNLVAVGGSTAVSVANLIAANNATAGSQGTLFSYNTIANVSAVASAGAGTSVVFTAIQPGASGNTVVTTETMSAGSWGAVTLAGGVAGALLVSGAGTPSGAIITQPAAYTGVGATSSSSNNTSVKVGPTVTTARKIDIVNTGTNGIWVNRGAAAAVASSYYLAQYGVFTCDEPTLDDFFFISPSGAQTCAYVPRTAA